MSSNLKRRVRERMEITGERYTEARAALLAADARARTWDPPGAARPLQGASPGSGEASAEEPTRPGEDERVSDRVLRRRGGPRG